MKRGRSDVQAHHLAALFAAAANYSDMLPRFGSGRYPNWTAIRESLSRKTTKRRKKRKP